MLQRWAESSKLEALRGSLSGKRGSCFEEGCTRGMAWHGMAWLPKQASVLSFHFCSLNSLQIPVCKQPGGMGSSKAGDVSHYAPGIRKPLISRHPCKAGSN